MENENKLSAFGWLIILAIFASICYWFSISESSSATLINVLNISAKSLILFILFITQFIAFEKEQDSLMTYVNVILLILSFETLMCNSTSLSGHTFNLVVFLGMLASILGGASAFLALCGLFIYIANLLDPKTGKLQALKDSLKQNPVTKLMFKQSKQEGPVEKVKI